MFDGLEDYSCDRIPNDSNDGSFEDLFDGVKLDLVDRMSDLVVVASHGSFDGFTDG